MNIDEAREKYARGLAISLTDRQIVDQHRAAPSVSGTPPLEAIQYISTIRGRMRVRGCVLATWRVSERRLLGTICVASWFGAGGTEFD